MPRPRTERGAASPATGMAPAARPWAVGAATVRAAAAGGAKADEACGARPGASVARAVTGVTVRFAFKLVLPAACARARRP
jgi:hypothetical protein